VQEWSHEGFTQSARPEVFRRADDGLVKVRVLKQLHGIGAPSPAIPVSSSPKSWYLRGVK
jgi:hypothetical protein